MNVHPQYPASRATTHVVTYWEIPGGYDYHNAYVITCFCTADEAERLVQEKGDIPEMAIATTYAEWLPVHRQRQLKRRAREAAEAAEYQLAQENFWLQD